MTLLLALLAVQGMGHMHMHMPGMAMPPAPARKSAPARPKPGRPARKAAAAPPPMDHATMDHGAMDHGAMDHGAMPGMDPAAMPAPPPPGARGTDLPAGTAPAPALPADHYADRDWSPAAMAAARHRMMREEGGRRFHRILFNLAEVQLRRGRDSYRWDGEGWYGGDIHRLVVKTEGEGDIGGRLDSAEVQALYSRAIGPYHDLQAGIRRDIRPGRSYATVGIEGLAPYECETEAALFLSDRGDLLARLEGWYDQRITQRLVLQPRIELNLSAQDVARDRIGSGLIDAELGLRLRYEFVREFAPYVGVSWERRLGDTARFARADGDRVGGAAAVFGVRTWF